MRLLLYLDGQHLPAWTWQAFRKGLLPLSGTDSQLLALALEMAGVGWDVSLCTSQAPGDIANGITQVKVDSLESAIRYGQAAGVDVVVFLNRGNEETLLRLHQAEVLKQRCVVWDQNGPTERFADAFLTPCVHSLVCVSATQTDAIRDHAVFAKTQFVYNSLHPIYDYTCCPQKNSKSVCFLGALSPAKGFHHLAKAWPAVRLRIPDATLTVIGSARLYDHAALLGPLGIAEPAYETAFIAPNLGSTVPRALDRGVTFLGLLPPKAIREALATVAVGVVNPNCSGSTETFCVSAIELQAAACAVVGGRSGGLLETVRHGKSGYLIRTESDLANTIVDMIAAPRRTALMGALGQRWATSTFSRRHFTVAWASLLEGAARDIPPRRVRLELSRLSLRTLARSILGCARSVPVIGAQLPTLSALKSRFRLR